MTEQLATEVDDSMEEWENLDPSERAEVDKQVLRHEVRNYCKSARLEAERVWRLSCTHGRPFLNATE